MTSIPLRFSVSRMEEITQAAKVLGRLGGLARSRKKAKTSKENGKKGGRPRKPKVAKQ